MFTQKHAGVNLKLHQKIERKFSDKFEQFDSKCRVTMGALFESKYLWIFTTCNYQWWNGKHWLPAKNPLTKNSYKKKCYLQAQYEFDKIQETYDSEVFYNYSIVIHAPLRYGWRDTRDDTKAKYLLLCLC